MAGEESKDERHLVDPRYALKEDLVALEDLVRTHNEEKLVMLKEQNAAIAKFELALFGNGDDVGLMGIAKKIDNHVDVVCNIGKWLYRTAVGILAVAAPALAAGHYLKWW